MAVGVGAGHLRTSQVDVRDGVELAGRGGQAGVDHVADTGDGDGGVGGVGGAERHHLVDHAGIQRHTGLQAHGRDAAHQADLQPIDRPVEMPDGVLAQDVDHLAELSRIDADHRVRRLDRDLDLAGFEGQCLFLLHAAAGGGACGVGATRERTPDFDEGGGHGGAPA